LLDGAWIEFLREPHVRLRISLDGPRDVHSLTRASHDYDAAVDAIRHAVGAGINIEINTVLTNALISRLGEFLNTVVSLGVKHLNLFTFIKRDVRAPSTGLEVDDGNLEFTKNVVRDYQDRCGAALSVRINDYRTASRQKLIVEPDGRLVGYSNIRSNDHIYGSALDPDVLADALRTSRPQDPIDLIR
jgi:sulfatase maturation enzyme AslB (radical SAM superfamily)